MFQQGERSYELQLYGFSHMSEDEFEKKFLGLLPPSDADDSNARKKRAILDESQCKNLPETKNWNLLKRVPYVKDQKNCGSCYIFSSTSAIECAVAVEYGISPLNMSRQNSLDCVLDPNVKELNGCRGGRPEWIWNIAKVEGGIVEETKENEYTGVPNKECNSKAVKASFTDVDYWEKVTTVGSPEEVEEQIKCRLATTGPFHVSMTVKKDSIGTFKSGVYKDSNGICVADEKVNHGLLLVGYGEKLLIGDLKPTKFWIIQNSWGERWGDQEYLNVERGTNVCNFAKDAYFPVLKKTLRSIDAPDVCKVIHDVFDTNKKYLKFLCLIEKDLTYEDSQVFCLKNGMRLFRTDTNETQDSLLNFANKAWIERDEDFTPYINGIVVDDEGAPTCKHITKEGEIFIKKDTDCADESQCICEFNNNNIEKNQ